MSRPAIFTQILFYSQFMPSATQKEHWQTDQTPQIAASDQVLHYRH